MTFTPKYRYIKVRTDHYGDSSGCEPILFAIDNEVILFSGDIEETSISDTDEIAKYIFQAAEKIAKIHGQELYEKTIDFKQSYDYLRMCDESNDFRDADYILCYADLDNNSYKSSSPGMTIDEGIGYDGRYEILEDDEKELITNQQRKPEIPAGAIQDQIEYLKSLDEIITLSVWTEDDLAEAIAANGYTDSCENILAVADEIYGLLGKNNTHKNFMLDLAINRAIKDGAIKD